MTVQSLSLPAVGADLLTACYLVSEGQSAVLIDAPSNADAVVSLLPKTGVNLCAILLTHGHFDHIGAVDDLCEMTGAPVYIGAQDAEMLANPDLNVSVSLTLSPLICRAKAIPVKEGDDLRFGSLAFSVMETPGHTRGSVCYRTGDHLFTGDTLFHGGYGRTDLPTGSISELRQSLRRLIPLSKTLTVYPGHI